MPESLPATFIDTLGPGDVALATSLHDLVLGAVPAAVVRHSGKLLVYELPAGHQIAALARRKDGFRLYLTPLYEHQDLAAEHEEAVAGVRVGKSCLRLRTDDDVPRAAVTALLVGGAARL